MKAFNLPGLTLYCGLSELCLSARVFLPTPKQLPADYQVRQRLIDLLGLPRSSYVPPHPDRVEFNAHCHKFTPMIRFLLTPHPIRPRAVTVPDERRAFLVSWS